MYANKGLIHILFILSRVSQQNGALLDIKAKLWHIWHLKQSVLLLYNLWSEFLHLAYGIANVGIAE